MKNKTVLITGCSSGIGLYTAKTLVQRGYQVFATARKKDDVERLRQEGLNSYRLDLDDSHSIQNAVKHVLNETNGHLYALFNNGAYGQPGAVEDLSRDTLRQQFETNLFGWHELTNLIIPVMRKQGYGRIIQNSSILGLVALSYRGAYNASKYALEGLTDTLRLELKGSGIRVSLIEPGPILSKFRQNSLLHLRDKIDINNSPHKDLYQSTLNRLKKDGPTVAFTLGPDAVFKMVLHALESNRPKIRYYVTLHTYVLGYLRHILPDRLMDKILVRV